MDSGATHHLTNDLENLAIHSKYTGPEEVTLGNGSKLSISHVGASHVSLNNCEFSLRDILYVLNAKQNLLSVNSFAKSNKDSLEFYPNYFLIKDLGTKATLYKGKSDCGLYSLSTMPMPSSAQSYSASLSPRHARLGHANAPTV